MTDTSSTLHRYDHRLKNLVRTTGDIAVATEYGVPASTARGWLRQSQIEVVLIELLDFNTSHLQQEVVKLRRRLEKLSSRLRLAIVVLQIFGVSLGRFRVRDGRDKKRLLRAIQRTSPRIPLRTSLGAIGLFRTR